MKNKEWTKLMGVVEADETYIGGKDRNRHWIKKSAQVRARLGEQPITGRAGDKYGYGQVGVIGAIERKGNVVAKVIGEADAETLSGFVRKTVSPNVSLLATDEKQDYKYVDARINPKHQAVKHSAGEYVRGTVHTNNIENFWSLLKRGVMGSFHHVSKAYLPLYLAEFTFRHNNRGNSDIFGELLSHC
jgi:transposase-like protein